MPLQGTFDVLDFSEVLRLLARQQLTGRLHVRSRSFAANLFLEDGTLVGADQSEHQAAAASGDVRGRLEEICFEMLDAERGGFDFQPGRPSTLPSTNKLRVDTVLSRARKRLQEWQELQELIPSLDLQPRLVEDLSANEVTIDQERWRMLTAVDGRRSLRAIGRTLAMSDFDVCRVVKALLEGGIVEMDPRAIAMANAAREAVAPPVATVDTPTVQEVVRVGERIANGAVGSLNGAANGAGRPAAPAGATAGLGPVGPVATVPLVFTEAVDADPDVDVDRPAGVDDPPEGGPALTVRPSNGGGEDHDAPLHVPEALDGAPEAGPGDDGVDGRGDAGDDDGGRGRRRRVVRIRSRSPRDPD